MSKFIELTAVGKNAPRANLLINIDFIKGVCWNEAGVCIAYTDGTRDIVCETYSEVKAKIRKAEEG